MSGLKIGRGTKMNDSEFMSIKEMIKHNWCVNWSGGKDSTATIIAMLKYNVPIKNVNYVRMMYDNEHPATLPEISDFVDNCIYRFKNQYGLKVNVVESEPFINILKKKYKRCKHKEKMEQYMDSIICVCLHAHLNHIKLKLQRVYKMKMILK